MVPGVAGRGAGASSSGATIVATASRRSRNSGASMPRRWRWRRAHAGSAQEGDHRQQRSRVGAGQSVGGGNHAGRRSLPAPRTRTATASPGLNPPRHGPMTRGLAVPLAEARDGGIGAAVGTQVPGGAEQRGDPPGEPAAVPCSPHRGTTLERKGQCGSEDEAQGAGDAEDPGGAGHRMAAVTTDPAQASTAAGHGTSTRGAASRTSSTSATRCVRAPPDRVIRPQPAGRWTGPPTAARAARWPVEHRTVDCQLLDVPQCGAPEPEERTPRWRP